MIARTSDGLQVFLELSFQYRLKTTAADIFALYNDFEDDYEEAYARIARDVIRNVAANYIAFDFFQARASIGGAMQQELDRQLRQWYASCESLQLLNFDLPTRFKYASPPPSLSRFLTQQQ
jgi:regulator of protease activity HflC (stomatin/prohibitin superfamily)